MHSTDTGRASSPAGDGKEEPIAARENHEPNLRPGLEPCQEELSFRVLRLPVWPVRLSLVILVLGTPAGAWGQGLPSFAPLNPISTSRSGLYYQPLREPAPKEENKSPTGSVRRGVDGSGGEALSARYRLRTGIEPCRGW